jgi:hypothetical protein
MLDIVTASSIAASTVTVLVSLLQKAIEKGAEKFGESSGKLLLDKLKSHLSHGGAKEALEDLSSDPADTDAQGALKMQLRKALQTDPALEAFLKQWSAESGSEVGISQVVNTYGNENRTTQITGSGNTVN